MCKGGEQLKKLLVMFHIKSAVVTQLIHNMAFDNYGKMSANLNIPIYLKVFASVTTASSS